MNILSMIHHENLQSITKHNSTQYTCSQLLTFNFYPTQSKNTNAQGRQGSRSRFRSHRILNFNLNIRKKGGKTGTLLSGYQPKYLPKFSLTNRTTNYPYYIIKLYILLINKYFLYKN